MQTIINVDDYAPGRYARTKILRQAGFRVEEASTGEDALRLVSELKPELVVLDVNLPDLNGIEVCQRVKQNPQTAGVIVVHLTASRISPGDMVHGLNNGADGYLTEPVEPAVLVATVRALLRARHAEEALRRANDELQEFAYMVAHELNEPLRMIASYTELLSQDYRGKLDAKADEYISQATSSARRMQTFVRDVLNFSIATAPERVFVPVSTDAVLVTALYELQMMVSESGAVITHDPLPVVSGNHMRLVRVFANLISNAIKYRRENEAPRVHISVHEQEDGFWRFEFRDNGQGIESQHWTYIFSMFKRLHGREYAGSGIGLALCKRVVENHGGTLWLESQPGTGSTFCFTLPKVIHPAAG